MNPKLPQIKAKELIRIASKLGFEFDRQSGSHAIYYALLDAEYPKIGKNFQEI